MGLVIQLMEELDKNFVFKVTSLTALQIRYKISLTIIALIQKIANISFYQWMITNKYAFLNVPNLLYLVLTQLQMLKHAMFLKIQIFNNTQLLIVMNHR